MAEFPSRHTLQRCQLAMVNDCMTVLFHANFYRVKENLPPDIVQEVEVSYPSVLCWRTSGPNDIFTLTFRKWPMVESNEGLESSRPGELSVGPMIECSCTS